MNQVRMKIVERLARDMMIIGECYKGGGFLVVDESAGCVSFPSLPTTGVGIPSYTHEEARSGEVLKWNLHCYRRQALNKGAHVRDSLG